MSIEPSVIHIAERAVGNGQPCFIIAEAGINHNGDLDTAMQLVDVAADAGVDAVKFITFNPDTLITKGAAKARYQKSGEDDKETFYQMLKGLWLPDDAFRQLNQRAKDRGIAFMSKGYLEELDFLIGLNVPVIKIDSASVVYFSLLQKAGRAGLPVILSTGGASLGEVERALDELAQVGCVDVILLHCTSAYPTPNDQVNLRAMETLKGAFGLNVGLSDHSEGIEIALAAVAFGATVIEKHFTLDRSMPGPDHQASLEPQELSNLVSGIRKIEAAMGDPRKKPTQLEAENMLVVRRSLVAEKAIEVGEVFSESSIAFKRPAGGLGEDFKSVVIGRTARRRLEAGDPITWDVIGGPLG
jgi:N,N'-diacetyllegionaminate synthase